MCREAKDNFWKQFVRQGSACQGSNPASGTHQLCGLGQVTEPLWGRRPSGESGGNNIIFLIRRGVTTASGTRPVSVTRAAQPQSLWAAFLLAY